MNTCPIIYLVWYNYKEHEYLIVVVHSTYQNSITQIGNITQLWCNTFVWTNAANYSCKSRDILMWDTVYSIIEKNKI